MAEKGRCTTEQFTSENGSVSEDSEATSEEASESESSSTYSSSASGESSVQFMKKVTKEVVTRESVILKKSIGGSSEGELPLEDAVGSQMDKNFDKVQKPEFNFGKVNEEDMKAASYEQKDIDVHQTESDVKVPKKSKEKQSKQNVAKDGKGKAKTKPSKSFYLYLRANKRRNKIHSSKW